MRNKRKKKRVKAVQELKPQNHSIGLECRFLPDKPRDTQGEARVGERDREREGENEGETRKGRERKRERMDER